MLSTLLILNHCKYNRSRLSIKNKKSWKSVVFHIFMPSYNVLSSLSTQKTWPTYPNWKWNIMATLNSSKLIIFLHGGVYSNSYFTIHSFTLLSTTINSFFDWFIGQHWKHVFFLLRWIVICTSSTSLADFDVAVIMFRVGSVALSILHTCFRISYIVDILPKS